MTADLQGTINFLDVGSDSADLSWLVAVTSDEETPPELRIDRLTKGKLDVKGPNMAIRENPDGTRVPGSKGSITVLARGKPDVDAGRFVWFFTLKSRAGGPDLELVLFVRAEADPFVEVARVQAASLRRSDLGTVTPVLAKLKEAPIPRLSLGINQTATPSIPGEYRTFKPGDGDPAKAVNGDTGDLQALLYRIFVLLDRPGTLNPIWDQQSLTKTVDSLNEDMFKVDKVRVAEELWARQVTEMLSFTPYGGPGVEYGLTAASDPDLITKGIDRAATDFHYGLYYGCEHLANFGVVSRGLHVLPTGRAINSGVGSIVTVMQMTDKDGKNNGQWLEASVPPRLRDTPTDDPALVAAGPSPFDLTPVLTQTFTNKSGTFRYQPGSVHVFANRAAFPNAPQAYERIMKDVADRKPQPSPVIVCAHVNEGGDLKELCATVVGFRARHQTTAIKASPSDPKQRFVKDNTASPAIPHTAFSIRARSGRVQFFDTGGLGVQGRGDGVNALTGGGGFHTGNFDDPPTTTIKGGQPYRGTGIFPPVGIKEAETMHEHVKTLRKARPIGLARLVLLRRARPAFLDSKSLPGALVYVSPLLPTFLNDGQPDSEVSNYALVRYLWSLRDLPGAANVEAVWMMYVPLGAFTLRMLSDGRTANPLTILRELHKAANDKADPKKRKTFHRFAFESIKAIGEVSSRANGTVVVQGKMGRSSSHELAKFVERGGPLSFAATLPQQTFERPPYFDG
jgi:hypothetical protein